MTSTRLTYVQGSSAKEYNVSIVAEDNGFKVNFAYGRIGAALTVGSKTPAPVTLEEAQKIAEKLLASKVKKGYVPDGETASEIHAVASSNKVIALPQLSVAVDVETAKSLLNDHTLIGQVKCDGERRTMIFNNENVTALNRRGVETAMDKRVADAYGTICNGLCYDSLTVDAEDMGDHLYIFDVLEMNGNDLRNTAFNQRVDILLDVQKDFVNYQDDNLSGHFAFANSVTIKDKDELTKFVEQHRSAQEEGVILRKASGVYEPGRPSSPAKAPSLKIKFTNDAQVVVYHVNTGKRSVSIAVLEGEDWRRMGNVTIPANADIPKKGDVINVGYLWCLGNEGCLIQPVFQRVRSDLTQEDCVANQLVYRDESILKRAV